MEAYTVTMSRNQATVRGRTAPTACEKRADFMALVREQDRILRMLAYRLIEDRQVIDDVLQDAYLKAYEGLPSFRNDATVATWLYRITYNTCLDHLRRKQREGGRGGPALSLDVLADVGQEPASTTDNADTAHLRQDLAAALSALPVPQRAVVVLVDAIGYDYATAAEILGLRPGTVASRLHKARRALKTSLSSHRTEAHR